MYFKSSAEISVVHQKLHTWFKVIPSLESKFNTQKHCFATIKIIQQSNNKLLNQNLTPLKVNASLKSKFNTQKHCFNSQKHSALKQQIMAAYVHCLDTQAKQFMTDTKLQCYF